MEKELEEKTIEQFCKVSLVEDIFVQFHREPFGQAHGRGTP